MDVKIHSVHFDADKKLIEFVENKVNKLDQFYDNIIGAEVFLRVEKEQSPDNKLTEIKLQIPGSDLFAKKQTDTFEESTDLAVNALRKQLTKRKAKQRGA
ncbi:MAG: ribosome-associated translation inhibitor RaiA [Bacteroidales bacterium]|nr:ribosome-associated translation inhibitor RaiA [Bacteroidales bacterium]